MKNAKLKGRLFLSRQTLHALQKPPIPVKLSRVGPQDICVIDQEKTQPDNSIHLGGILSIVLKLTEARPASEAASEV